VILPLRTAATTAALRRITHLVVLGGGKSSIGGTCSAVSSMTPFSGLHGQKIVVHSLGILVAKLGCLPRRNSECGHCHFIVALIAH
jgi:hypothetical protein